MHHCKPAASSAQGLVLPGVSLNDQSVAGRNYSNLHQECNKRMGRNEEILTFLVPRWIWTAGALACAPKVTTCEVFGMPQIDDNVHARGSHGGRKVSHAETAAFS